MSSKRSTAWNLLIILMMGAAGCGEKLDRPDLVQVTGAVTYNDKPLPQGVIVFLPAKGRPASGAIKDGQIVDVTTYDKTGDGIAPGAYQVTVQSLDKPGADMYTATKSLIPTRYNDPVKSGLTADIKPGDNSPLKFELKD